MTWFLIGFLWLGSWQAVPVPSPVGGYQTLAACEAAGERWKAQGPNRDFHCRGSASRSPEV